MSDLSDDMSESDWLEGKRYEDKFPPNERDLLAELHDEQCAHGATLRQLDDARAEVERLNAAIQEAIAALDFADTAAAWNTLHDASDITALPTGGQRD